jgi:hypothetical protein
VTDTPQDKLTRAAEVLRETAAKATPGPWVWQDGWSCVELVHPQEFGGMPAHPANVLKSQSEHWPPSRHDAAWIALMSPELGAHIAAWLERCAEDYRSERKAQSKWPEGRGYTMLLPDDFEAAVEFAELILRSAS